VFGLTRRMLIVIGVLVAVVVLLVIQNGKKGSAQPGTTSAACQVQVTADVLNIRSGPDDTATVVGKLATGAVVGAQAKVQNNYRELATNRWASSQFLKPVSGSC
jgi:competence protein ComGC